MTKPMYDVAGIGNAIVDILSFTDDEFIASHGIVKGSMTLVDEEHSKKLYKKIGEARECSGGSVANTLAGLASLGAKCAFIGKVASDQLGDIFTHDMRTIGVHFATRPLTSGPATANCLVCVTPDAQRTMITYLGACTKVTEMDINETVIAGAPITYVEGYLWDAEPVKAAIRKAIAVARANERSVAFTLSDTFCVDRHREEFLQLIEHHVDILFANEAEITSLYRTNFDDAIARLQRVCKLAAVTRSEKGSVVVTHNSIKAVPTAKIDKVVDTTGAGDLYASGFLFGLTHGWEPEACAELGNRCAGEIIQQIGARSLKPLDRLLHAA